LGGAREISRKFRCVAACRGELFGRDGNIPQREEPAETERDGDEEAGRANAPRCINEGWWEPYRFFAAFFFAAFFATFFTAFFFAAFFATDPRFPAPFAAPFVFLRAPELFFTGALFFLAGAAFFFFFEAVFFPPDR